MAQIAFTPEEAINLLTANDLLPEVITDIKVKDDTLLLRVATPLPLVNSLPVSIKYVGFENGIVTLQLSADYLKGRILDTVLKLVNAKLEQDFPDKIQLDYPNLYVHINKLLVDRNIRAVQVRQITFDSGLFTVTMVAA
ncbi:MAG: hypothetical protein ACYST6_06845 [Planctomycetota bacterium]|jgi:hypothetical protein